MEERYLEITNFRNIGIKKAQRLLLNSSLDQKTIGSVVYIIGPNNSGKSNCLDALEAFGNNNIRQEDIPDFDLNDPIPSLSLICTKDETYYKITKSGNNAGLQTEYSSSGPKSTSSTTINISDQAKAFGIKLISFVANSNYLNYFGNEISKQTCKSIASTGQYVENHTIYDEAWAVYQRIFGGNTNINSLGNTNVKIVLGFPENEIANYLVELRTANHREDFPEYKNKYGYDLEPSIIRFRETNFSQSQFTTNYSLNNSDFFKTLLNSIGYKIEQISNVYSKYKNQKMRGILEYTQNDINSKLISVSDQFNKLYFLDNTNYSFKIYLDPQDISFQIMLGDLPLQYDRQSTGFKWFFNFYFTLYLENRFKRGDIILYDEPATSLHVQGVTELRDFLLEYAKKTGLTFVISTHSPFFIDVDHLEQVRVVSREEKESVINSKFQVMLGDDTDALGPVTNALTIGRHILLNPAIKTIYVEGITDYCYLTAMRDILKISGYVFLPVQGLKRRQDKDLFEKLLKFDHFPTLLVDGDEAGKICLEKAEKFNKDKMKIEVISLSEADPSFLTIESLFAEEDKQVSKYFSDVISFKANINKAKLNKQTIDNFRLLFEKVICI